MKGAKKTIALVLLGLFYPACWQLASAVVRRAGQARLRPQVRCQRHLVEERRAAEVVDVAPGAAQRPRMRLR